MGLADDAKDRNELLTICGEEGNSSTHSTSTASTTDAVNVVLRVIRVIVVEHMSDVLHVFGAQNVSSVL